MRMHPRVSVVTRARSDLAERVNGWHKTHTDLTDGELLGIISDVLGNEIAALAKYMVHAERHPDDTDKPGGLE